MTSEKFDLLSWLRDRRESPSQIFCDKVNMALKKKWRRPVVRRMSSSSSPPDFYWLPSSSQRLTPEHVFNSGVVAGRDADGSVVLVGAVLVTLPGYASRAQYEPGAVRRRSKISSSASENEQMTPASMKIKDFKMDFDGAEDFLLTTDDDYCLLLNHKRRGLQWIVAEGNEELFNDFAVIGGFDPVAKRIIYVGRAFLVDPTTGAHVVVVGGVDVERRRLRYRREGRLCEASCFEILCVSGDVILKSMIPASVGAKSTPGWLDHGGFKKHGVSRGTKEHPISSNERAPPNALVAGLDAASRPIFVGKAISYDKELPGTAVKIGSSFHFSFASCGGEIHRTRRFQFMTFDDDFAYEWRRVDDRVRNERRLPENAVSFNGKRGIGNTDLFVGRLRIKHSTEEEETIVGKVIPLFGVLSIRNDDGSERKVKEGFEILCAKYQPLSLLDQSRARILRWSRGLPANIKRLPIPDSLMKRYFWNGSSTITKEKMELVWLG